MQAIERGGYSREEILEVLHAKNNSRNVRFRYDLLDKAGRFKEKLDCVISGEIEQSAFSTIKRTAKFKVKEEVIPAYEQDEVKTHEDLRTSQEDFTGGLHFNTGTGAGTVSFDASPLNYAPNPLFDNITEKTTPTQDIGLAPDWSSFGNTAGTQDKATYGTGANLGMFGGGQRMTRKASGAIGIQTTSKAVLTGLGSGVDVWCSVAFKPPSFGEPMPTLVTLVYSDGTFTDFDMSGATQEILENGWHRWTGKAVATKSLNAGVQISFNEPSYISGTYYFDNIHLGKITRPEWYGEWTTPVFEMGEDGNGEIDSTTVTYDYRVLYGSTMRVLSSYSLNKGVTWSSFAPQASGAPLAGLPTKAGIVGKLFVRFKVDFVRYYSLSNTNYFDEFRTTVVKHYMNYFPETTKINYLQDKIQPFMEIQMTDGRWISFPLGVFLLSTPTRYDGANGVIYRDIEAYDGLLILDEDKFTTRYVVNAGVKYTDAIASIISSVGVGEVAGTIKYTIEESSKKLVAPKEFKIGTSKLEAVNELLTALNYTPLWVDSYGYFQAFPYVSPADRATDYSYIDNELSVMYNGMEEELDLNAVPNIWSAVESNPDKPTPLFTRLTNADPTSPTSTVNVGRRIVDYREVDEMADQATLNLYVRRIAFEASQVFGKLKFKTALMPFHEYSDILHVRYSPLKIDHKFSETNWKMPLKAGAEMEHEARRVVELNVT